MWGNIKVKKIFRHNAFTLIELITTIVLIGIIGTFIVAMLMEGFRAYFTARDLNDSAAEGRFALHRFAQDFRQLNPGDLACISSSTPIWFVPNSNRVRAYSSMPANTIARFDGLGWRPIAGPITPGSLQFRYLQRDGITEIIPTSLVDCNPAIVKKVFYVTMSFNLTNTIFSGSTITTPLSNTVFIRRLE